MGAATLLLSYNPQVVRPVSCTLIATGLDGGSCNPAFEPGNVKFNLLSAEGVTGNQYFTVGDATGWLRPFKGKGINMAIETGILAADKMIEHGISVASFRRYEEAARPLRDDYAYGTWMRNLCKMGEIAGTLGTVISMAKFDQRIHDALFNAVSGHDSFKNIFKAYAKPSVLVDVVRNYLMERRRRK